MSIKTIARRVESAPAWVLFSLFLAPILIGAIQRLHRPNHWFKDYDAFSCAAARVNQHLPLYSMAFPCPDQQPTNYVYPPYLATVWAALQHSVGLIGATALYGALYYFLLFYVLRRFIAGDLGGGPAAMRAAMLVAIGPDIFNCGNVAVIIHGVIALVLLCAWDYPFVLLGSIVLAASIKPVYLVYVAVFLFHPMQNYKKILYCIGTVSFGLTPFLLFKLNHAALFQSDMALIKYFATVNERGYGFLNLAGLLGISEVSVFMAVSYCLFAAILLGGALYICHRGQAKTPEKLWIGVTTAVMADPKLMFYDLLTLMPGLVCVIALSRRLGATAYRINCGYSLLVCGVCLALNSRGGQHGMYLFIPAFYLLIVANAAAFYRQRHAVSDVEYPFPLAPRESGAAGPGSGVLADEARHRDARELIG